MMTDSLALEKYRHNSRKASNSSLIAEIDTEDLDNEEQKPFLKKTIKSLDPNNRATRTLRIL